MLTDSTNKNVYNISSSSAPLSDGYEITFAYFSPDYVKVYVQNSDGTQSEVSTSDYTVDEGTTTSTVKFVSDYSFPEGSTYLTIIREVPFDQPADYRNGADMNAEDIEHSLDYLTAQTQQLFEASDRTIQLPKSETGNMTMPSKQARSGMLLGFDENGDMIGVLVSDIDQKLSQALDAEESTLEAAEQTAQTKEEVEDLSELAERYAKGTVNGVSVQDGEGYQDNSKYYRDQAKQEAIDGIAAIDARTETKKTELDNYVNQTSKPALDTYVGQTSKAEIDNYVADKKEELDDHTAEKKTELDNYVNQTSKPALDTYVGQTSKAEIDDYVAQKQTAFDIHVAAKVYEADLAIDDKKTDAIAQIQVIMNSLILADTEYETL